MAALNLADFIFLVIQAWSPPGAQATYLSNACEIGDAIVTMEEKGMPVIGEPCKHKKRPILLLNTALVLLRSSCTEGRKYRCRKLTRTSSHICRAFFVC